MRNTLLRVVRLMLDAEATMTGEAITFTYRRKAYIMVVARVT